jgi:GT2 family glycosyltransferase
MISPDEPLISVVIPNYNGEAFLAECIGSLLEQSLEQAEIILVDNASTDGSIELVERNYPQTNIVRLEENRGFSVAVNAGIQVGKGEFVVLLNNDTRAEPDFLAEMHAAILANEAAMAAPKMLFSRDSRIINSLGLGYSIAGTNHDIGFGLEDGPKFGEREWIFGPCGGAGMYRRRVLEDVGSFDEDFFMYYEDVDFSFRAQLAGYRCISAPLARVHHLEGASARALPKPRNFYLTRNAFTVIVKNFPRRLLMRHAHVLLWEMAKRAGSPLLRGDFSAILGYLAGLAHLGVTLRKRQEIQGHRKIPDVQIDDMLKKNLAILKEINLQGRPAEGTS